METPESLIKSLRSVRHFQKLSAADVAAIVTAGRLHRFPAGAQIFAEGEPCAGMFVLLEGRVHLRKLGPQGQESILAVVEPVILQSRFIGGKWHDRRRTLSHPGLSLARRQR